MFSPFLFHFIILFQKLQVRQKSFNKRTLREKDCEKWSKVLTSDFISSEESGEEDNSIIVKSLPWRAPRVDAFFHSLDESARNRKSPQSLRQMKTRVLGEQSTREKPPSGRNLPSWGLTN